MRIRTSNRKRGKLAREQARLVQSLRLAICEKDREVNRIGALLLAAKRNLQDAERNAERRANEIAERLLSDKYTEEMIMRAAQAVGDADAREVYKWMEQNQKTCRMHGLYTIERARQFIDAHRDAYSPPRTPQIGIFQDEGCITTVEVGLPALHFRFRVLEL